MSQLDKGWDPGGTTMKINEIYNDEDKIFNDAIYNKLVAALDDSEMNTNESSRTESDSHANMAVIGRQTYILAETGKMVEVNPFTPTYKPIEAPIVDDALQYNSPYDGKCYILVVRNALHVPSMCNNLPPPFMLQEAGITVNDKAKIHMTNLTAEDHAIIFPERGFRIPMMLWGIFSNFPTMKPTVDALHAGNDVYILTPTTWDQHTDIHATNEDSMLDCEGNIKEKRGWECQVVLEDVDDHVNASSLIISVIEMKAKIDEEMMHHECEEEETIKCSLPQIDISVIAEISTALDKNIFSRMLTESGQLSRRK